MKYFYVCKSCCLYLKPEEYEELITEVHKAKVGYSPGQAESEFLQICKKLPRYGMHLFAAKVRFDIRIILHAVLFTGIL